jgi:hypothetical protein
MSYGVSKRVYLEHAEVIGLTRPLDVFNVWTERGVKGRALVLFDRKIHASQEETPLSDDNYIYMAIMNNSIRKIYHIVPDSSWGEVKNALSGIPSVTFSKGVFRTTIEGTPLFIMRVRGLPVLEERVLLHVNGDYWNNGDINDIFTLLKNNNIKADLVTLSGTVSDGTAERFKSLL